MWVRKQGKGPQSYTLILFFKCLTWQCRAHLKGVAKNLVKHLPYHKSEVAALFCCLQKYTVM